MLSRRRRLAVIATSLGAVLSGCGQDGDGGDQRSSTATPSPTTAPEQRERERFPDRPQIEIDFAGGGSDALPAFRRPTGSGAHTDRSYRLRLAEGDAVRAPARRAAEPGSAAVSVVATVRAPTRLDGRAGVFCRGSADGRTGYELTVDRRGRVRLERVQDTRRTLLAGYDARIDAAVPPDEPLPVVMSCGTGTERGSGVTLGIAVGAQQLTLIADPRPLPTGPRREAGLVVVGDAPAQADFAAFQLSFAG